MYVFSLLFFGIAMLAHTSLSAVSGSPTPTAAFGAAVASETSGGATALAPLGGDADCRQAMQYDTSNDTIITCPSSIQCTNANNMCLRRAVEIPGYIGITYCSCVDIASGDPFPNEVCHIYRWHQGSVTRPLCNNEGCSSPQSCKLPSGDDDLTVIQCSCRN